MSDDDRKINEATAEEAGGAPADQTEGAAEAREQPAESGVRKVNLRDMPPAQPDEEGGPRGLEPTRYGDWERKGRVSDF